MPHVPVQHVLARIAALSVDDQRALYHQLLPWLTTMAQTDPATVPSVQDVREARFPAGVRCPHCHDKNIRPWGSYAGRRRYRCRVCRRTFNDLTLTPSAYSKHPHKWGQLTACLLEGDSVRKTAAKLGVHRNTAFRWRHRVLRSLRAGKKPTLSGIVETDETYFHVSFKGLRNLEARLKRPPRRRGVRAGKRGLSREQACVLVERDRQKQTATKLIRCGIPKETHLARLLDKVLSSDVTLVSDAASSYRNFCRHRNLGHEVVPRRQVCGIYHGQNVNAYHSRFKGWMHHFHGVATKYLDNYSTWFLFVDTTRQLAPFAAMHQLFTSACAIFLEAA